MVIKKEYLLLLFLFICSILYPDDINYNLSLSSESVEAGEIFQINLEVLNNQNVTISYSGNNPDILMKEAGRSTSFSIINGKQSLSMTYTYIAKINKPGEYSIGSFKLSDRNNTIETESLNISVTTSETATTQTDYQKDQGEDYFIKIISSKDDIVVNEYIDISVKFYAISSDIRQIDYKQLEFPQSSWIENIKVGDDYKGRSKINGRVYDEYEIEKKRLFINKSGVFTIEPVVFNLYVFSRSSMFSHNATPISVVSNQLTIKVADLPHNKNNKTLVPVGNFNITYEISNVNVIENKSITLKVFLTGEGNFHNIDNLNMSFTKGIEKYSSKSQIIMKNNRASGKMWEIVLVPKKIGKHHITIDEFSFFDITQKKYSKIEESKIELNVAIDPDKRVQNVSTIIRSDEPVKKIVREHKLSFISTTLGSVNKFKIININFIVFSIVYSLFFLSIFIYFIVILFKRYCHIICNVNHELVLLKAIESINRNINKNSAEHSAEAMSHAFEKYIIHKFYLNSVNFTKSNLLELLNDKVSCDNINEIKDILTDLDLIRFGGGDTTIDGLIGLGQKIINLSQKL